MAARLPQPGSDDGVWGNILNDFLSVAHNSDGSIQDGLITDANIAPTAAITRTKLDTSTQASLGKADTALQSAPVTSVNSKTGAVNLAASDVGAIKGTEATTAPSSPATNDLWYDSSNDLWKRWDGSTWVVSDSSNTYTAAGQIRVGTGYGQSELLPKAGAGTFLRVGGADPSGLQWGIFTLSDSVEVIGNLMTAKGQLIVGTGYAGSEVLSVGSDGQTLVADSTQIPGVAWKTLAGGLLATNVVSTLTVGTTTTATATGASITFVAPSSGKVLMRISAYVEGTNNGAGGTTWTLSWVNHTGGATLGSGQVYNYNNGSSTMTTGVGVSMATVLSGLTAGQSYTLDLYGQYTTAQGPSVAKDATLEAWSA